MDINCVKCGEPWEIDTIHEFAEDDGVSFEEKRNEFRTRGCKAFHSRCNDEPVPMKASVAAAAFDLMGDDIDGVASMMEDAELLGMFD